MKTGAVRVMLRVEVTKEIIAEIWAYVEKEAPREACGILLGHGDRDVAVTGWVGIANRADRPETRFELDPAQLIPYLVRDDNEHTKPVGLFHSHPFSPPVPSNEDRRTLWRWPTYWIFAVAHKEWRVYDAEWVPMEPLWIE